MRWASSRVPSRLRHGAEDEGADEDGHERAEEQDRGLAVLGGHGRPTARADPLGSVAEHVRWEGPLVEASDLDAEAVVRALDELWRRRIVRETASGYDFSHDLLREAADALASPPTRWLLHRRLAHALEELHADDLDAVSARLARHHARSGRPEQAVSAYRRAAHVAASRFAHGEAIRLLREALLLVRALPAGQHRDEEELALREVLTAPLNARHGYASPVVRETLEASVALAHRMGRRDAELSALVGLWTARFVAGAVGESEAIATRVLAMADGAPALARARPFRRRPDRRSASDGPGGRCATSRSSPTRRTRCRSASAPASTCTVRRGPPTPTGCSATTTGPAGPPRRPSRWHAASSTPTASPWRWPTARSPTSSATTARPWQASVAELHRAVRALRLRLLPRVGARARSAGRGAVPRAPRPRTAASTGCGPRGRSPGCPTGSRWSPTSRSGGGIGTRHGRCSTRRSPTPGPASDVWWLPEVLRRRAALDDGPVAVERLRAAAALAREHGSTALLRRCHADLRAVDPTALTERSTAPQPYG